jgi:predicted adenylyl cyclase CyaB
LYFYNKEEIKTKTKGPGSFVLRIRKANNCYLTYKAFTEQTGCWIEHEVIIDDPEAMKEILIKSDFVQIIKIAKSRIKGKLDEFELCLDNVEDFGTYMEIALEDIDKEIARKKLIELLNKLGFEEKDIIHQGYPELMLLKKGYSFHGMK